MPNLSNGRNMNKPSWGVVKKDVPPRSLVVGVPAKWRREVTQAEAAELIEHARHYQKLALVHAGKGTDLGFTHT